MSTKNDTIALTGNTAGKLDHRKCKELDAQKAAMLESQEVKAITGKGDEWWCPNPECEIVDK